ncbi:MAG: hypothetical protein EZS28_020323, partial [Streblomastix strix]
MSRIPSRVSDSLRSAANDGLKELTLGITGCLKSIPNT